MVKIITQEILEDKELSGLIREDAFRIIIKTTVSNRIPSKMRQTPRRTPMPILKQQDFGRKYAKHVDFPIKHHEIVKKMVEATLEEDKHCLVLSQKLNSPHTTTSPEKSFNQLHSNHKVTLF